MYPRSFSYLLVSVSIALLTACSASRKTAEEPVAANQFFMLVLEVRENAPGSLEFTPIFEGWKEGKLKPFGPGPERDGPSTWRVDHLAADGAVLSAEWVQDPMRAVYEYSEDGQNIESVEFSLKESALALRIPGRVNGKKHGTDRIVIYRLHQADRPDEKLYEYHLPPL